MNTKVRQAGPRGASLIEVVTACLLLAIIAIAGVSALYQTGAGLAIQKNRRIALGLANSRLEEIRSTAYGVLVALIPVNSNVNSVIRNASGQFAVGSGETVSVGGKQMPLFTTLQYLDADGGLTTYDYLRVTASVQYRTERDVVTLQTMKGP
jgi:hypothetical protein